MKKQIPAAILALLLTMSGTAFAAELPEEMPPDSTQEVTIQTPLSPAYYPSEVRMGAEEGNPRIEKVYILTSRDDPAQIPVFDFQQEGYRYTLLDVLKNDHSDTDTKEHIEVFTQESATKDMTEILQTLEPTLDYTSEDGYLGTLTLDHTTICVEAAGYSNRSYTVSATRTYPNLSDADLSLVPKTVEENGRTLTLADVEWQTAAGTQADGYELAVRYNAVASYTGTATSKNATGYIVTAEYYGDITKTSTDTVVYTAVFSGIPIGETMQSSQTEDGTAFHVTNIPPVAVGVGAVAVIGLAALCVLNKKRK